MRNRSARVGMIVATIIVVSGIAGFLIKPAKHMEDLGKKGFAVLELFTSEGCSSCPAADALLAKIADSHPDDVYMLSFHVDYWNRLGWNDEFSRAAYSERQRDYVEHFKLNGAYTPQVIINGKEQVVGSDAAGLRRSIGALTRTSDHPSIKLFATQAPHNGVLVTYRTAVPANAVLNAALLQSAAQTNVERGENEGRILHHINIVRDFKTIENFAQSGEISLALPDGITAKQCKVIVYMQQKYTKEITSVAATGIQ